MPGRDSQGVNRIPRTIKGIKHSCASNILPLLLSTITALLCVLAYGWYHQVRSFFRCVVDAEPYRSFYRMTGLSIQGLYTALQGSDVTLRSTALQNHFEGEPQLHGREVTSQLSSLIQATCR